jgi:hypothetical protein
MDREKGGPEVRVPSENQVVSNEPGDEDAAAQRDAVDVANA